MIVGGHNCSVGKMKIDFAIRKGTLAAAKATAVYQYGLESIQESTVSSRM